MKFPVAELLIVAVIIIIGGALFAPPLDDLKPSHLEHLHIPEADAWQ